MSRAAAASRLGMRIVECDVCDHTVCRDDALVVVPNSEAPTTNVSGGRYVCSLQCARIHSGTVAGFLRCYRWNLRDETWTEMGARPNTTKRWEWTDTGEARWIEENAERLRNAGEIR